MKNVILITALFVGFGFGANAQSTQGKPAPKRTVPKTQKQVAPVKQTAELKSTAAYNANAPVIAPVVLALPRMDADTTGLPAVKTN